MRVPCGHFGRNSFRFLLTEIFGITSLWRWSTYIGRNIRRSISLPWFGNSVKEFKTVKMTTAISIGWPDFIGKCRFIFLRFSHRSLTGQFGTMESTLWRETGNSSSRRLYTYAPFSALSSLMRTKLMRPKADKITRRSFKNFDQKAFLCDLNYAFLGRVHFWRSERCLLLQGTTLQSSTRYAPITTTTKRQTIGSKFITPDIRKSMRLKKKFNKSRNHEDWEKYRLIRNKIVSMRRKHCKIIFNDSV